MNHVLFVINSISIGAWNKAIFTGLVNHTGLKVLSSPTARENELEKVAHDTKSSDLNIVIERLKKALQDGENSFNELFNSSAILQWIYHPESLLLLLVNDAAIRKFEYNAEELLNRTVLEMSPKEERQKLILYNEFMRSTHESFTVMNFYQKKNSEIMQAEAAYLNIAYKGQNCVLVSFIDAVEKIKLQEKIILPEVNRQQKITLGVINRQEKERDDISQELHENICQLLATAKVYLGLARKNKQQENEYIEEAEDILQHTINDIRKLSNSLVPSSMKIIGFEQSLRSLFNTFQLSKIFTIILSFDPAIEKLDNGIQISLFRIIQEQLNNILKHAQAKKIMISLDASEQISLSITDNGRGCDTGIKHAGTGIKNIENRVALYNGTVKIVSSPQNGYTLLVNIPTDNNKSDKPCINILVVEDDQDDQEIITRAFSEVAPHCNITCLNDGSVLVNMLQSFSDEELPCLIVLDYNMPLLNGLETLKILETDKRFNKIPKIIYSSSSQSYIKNLSYSANAKAYITKGITMDEIKENVSEMMSFMTAGNN